MRSKTVGRLTKRQSLADQAYESLRDAVLHGRLKPEQRLNQVELATDLGVSDRTVREALARLVAEGLISREPYREFRVIGVTAEDIEDIVQMRILLEGWAMELAAAAMSEEELARMESLIPTMNTDDALQSAASFQGCNRDFHWIAITACRKRHLIDMLRRLWNLMLPYSLTENDAAHALMRKGDIERQQRSHMELVEALAAGDGSGARAVLGRHSEEAMEQVRMGVKRLNRLSRRKNGRVFVQPFLPIRTSCRDL